MRTIGATQLAVWLIIGAAAFTFLKWQNEDIDRASTPPIPFLLESPSRRVPGKLDSLPKPFARLKAPIVLIPRADPDLPPPRKLRAEPGQPVSVSVTAYCLLGRTRVGTRAREGIVAADPRVFPLNSEIELIIGKDTLGKFRVEDTGFLIKGRKLDLWLTDCAQARAFGRKRGQATLSSKIRR